MALQIVTTEDLQLAYRVVDVLADQLGREVIPGLVLAAAAEILRIELRRRTVHDPLPGQLGLT